MEDSSRRKDWRTMKSIPGFKQKDANFFLILGTTMRGVVCRHYPMTPQELISKLVSCITEGVGFSRATSRNIVKIEAWSHSLRVS